MRPASIVAAFLAACGGGTARQRLPDDRVVHTQLADEDRYVPTYGKPELQKALIAERALEATGEQTVAELQSKATDVASDDRLRIAMADLAVRRRFITTLEACEASGSWCPPRLDDPTWSYDYDGDRVDSPPLDTALRFELDGWRKITGELHARTCACRTIGCVDGLTVAIDVLERRPTPEVSGDDAATLAVTRARECLFRLRGKSHGRASSAPLP